MPKTIHLCDNESEGISIIWTKSNRSLRISGWYDSHRNNRSLGCGQLEVRLLPSVVRIHKLKVQVVHHQRKCVHCHKLCESFAEADSSAAEEWTE